AYGNGFHYHRCANAKTCHRRATNWIANDRVWLCEACSKLYLSAKQQPSTNPKTVSKQNLLELSERQSSPVEDQQAERRLPDYWAACLSYLTLSRYADVALRSFAYDRKLYQASQTDTGEFHDHGYRSWYWNAVGVL